MDIMLFGCVGMCTWIIWRVAKGDGNLDLL